MSTDATPLRLEGLRLVPIGPLERPVLDGVLAGLSRRVGVPCRLQGPLHDLDLPRLAGREQLDADVLLASLEALQDEDGEVIVGLTSHDVGNPIFTFFFGRARHGGGAALVSLARLTPAFYGLPEDEALTVQRAVTEILHELGHVAGLDHCDEPTCVMRFCTNVGALDQRGSRFCAACQAALPQAFGRR
jgi:archaemetzincin